MIVLYSAQKIFPTVGPEVVMYLKIALARQLLAASPVFVNEFLMGLGYGWTAPILRQILDNPNADLTLTLEQSSWIGSMHEVGHFIGPLITMWLLGRIGRKGIFAMCSITLFITFTLIAFTRSVSVIYASRLIFGISVGMSDVTSAIYLSENFKPTYRAIFGSIAIACFYSGFLMDLCLVNFMNYGPVAYTNSAVAFLGLVNIFALTETPQYLILQGNYEQATKNFLWLQGMKATGNEDLTEFEKLKQHIDDQTKENRTIMALLSNPINRRAIMMVLLFCMLTMATGFSAVTSYVSIAFIEGVLTSNEYAILFGTIQLISTMLAPTFIEKANRRTILMWALAVVMIVNATTALLFYLQDKIYIPYFSWLVFATITMYAATFSSGIQTITYTTRGELLPPNVQSFGGSLSIMGNGLIGFLIAQKFLIVSEMFGIYWNFIFYSVMSLMSILFVYFKLPETRGKSLMQIHMELQSGNSRK